MKTFTFEAEQFIARPVAEVFKFFSDPHNLERITPPMLNFKIVGMSTPKIEKGTVIDYVLKIRGVPVRWKTLIEDWIENEMFVDTQLRGPYKLWHHTHKFIPQNGGTLILDSVKFQLPFGFIGALIAGALVQRDVRGIFSHRQKVIEQTFT